MLQSAVRPLAENDWHLVEEAQSLILRRGEFGKHHISSAVMTSDGEVYFGLHLSANIGVGSVCAEAVAIGCSQLEHHREIERLVSLRCMFDLDGTAEVVPPCGACRQLLLEYGPDSSVILPGVDGLGLVLASELLPLPFVRRRSSWGDGREIPSEEDL